MIHGDCELRIGHETLRIAVQEYLARHFVDGMCPTVVRVQEIVSGNDATRRYLLSLEPAARDASAPITDIAETRAKRRIDVGA